MSNITTCKTSPVSLLFTSIAILTSLTFIKSDFPKKIKICGKFFDFWKKKLDLWKKFGFLEKLWIFGKNLDFWKEFGFSENFRFSQKFKIFGKFSDLQKIFRLLKEFLHLLHLPHLLHLLHLFHLLHLGVFSQNVPFIKTNSF